MNTYDIYYIKSKVLSKSSIIYNHIIDNNYNYIKNLLEFVEKIADDNKCNITNNNLINGLITNMNNWIYISGYKHILYENISTFICNCDFEDKEMLIFVKQFNEII
jgi:hypothetical protein